MQHFEVTITAHERMSSRNTVKLTGLLCTLERYSCTYLLNVQFHRTEKNPKRRYSENHGNVSIIIEKRRADRSPLFSYTHQSKTRVYKEAQEEKREKREEATNDLCGPLFRTTACTYYFSSSSPFFILLHLFKIQWINTSRDFFHRRETFQ